MPQIVDTDALYTSGLCPSVHLAVQIALGDGKDAVCRTEAVQRFQIILHLLREKPRNPDDPIALGGFWLRDDILPLEPLIGLIDRQRGALKIEILCCQRQQLAHADAAPVQHLEGVVGHGLVHHGFSKFQILLLCPEQHFPVHLLAHVSGNFSGILLQAVILHRVVEDRAELAVDRLEIGRGIGLSVLLADAHERVLPCDHVAWLDLAECPILEVGENLGVNHVVLGFPGVLTDAFALIAPVDLNEVAELHVGVCVPLEQELPLPLQRIALELEASLHLLASCAGKIGVVERGVERSVLFIPVSWQLHHLLLGQTIELLLKVLSADSPGNGGVAQLLEPFVPDMDHFICRCLGYAERLGDFLCIHQNRVLQGYSSCVTIYFCLVTGYIIR